MAVVLDALASYVTNMLTQMAREEVAMLIGVSTGIDDLAIKLGDLKNFLADADRRNISDQSVQVWVSELKRALYEATNILDLCQLKVIEQGPSYIGCLNPLVFCMRSPLHAHNIGGRIKALNQKLDNICKRGGSFNFIKLEAYMDRRTTLSDRKTNPVLEQSSVVGEKIEDDTRALVDMLTNEIGDKSDGIMIVAVVGVGGIGKTTLGKMVFNDEKIQGRFAKKIWLSITQELNEVELLRTAITAADGNLPGLGGGSQDKALLVPALANTIKDKKIFLVLDDMWGSNEWNNLFKAPISHAAPGSRVLITTRHETVARSVRAVHPYHHVKKLNQEDGWSLLKKQILVAEESEHAIDILKDIGLQIIEKCDGLPLAIKVMGGLLCQKQKEQRDWEKVLNNTIWSVSQMPEELNYAIYLSYEDLPRCLRQCFLHFSLKPKNMVLSVNQTISMWIGEGLIHGDSHCLEEEGNKYYKELIMRNLIEPDTNYPGQLIGNMHDVIRSFAHFVARDEAFIEQNGDIVSSKLRLQRFIRLSVETQTLESGEFEWKYLREQKALRTLILAGKLRIKPGDSLTTFSSLRILHIEFANFSALVESVYELKHLRYLALRGCTDLSKLPERIQDMKLLQHIDLEGCQGFLELPDGIVKLQELRYLDIDDTHVNSIPRGFCALTNLLVLCGFPAYTDGEWCSLEELGPLSKLKELGLEGLENVSNASSVAKAKLGEKIHLSNLVLKCSSRVGYDGLVKGEVHEEKQRIEDVFNGFYPLPCLEYLRIKGYFGHQLPRWMMSSSTVPLKSLRILAMDDMPCCTKLPDGLCQLPCLEFLQVYQAPAIMHVGPEFVQPCNNCENTSSLVAAAFPKLHRMVLNGMVEWEEWEWVEEVQAMHLLEDLFIQSCQLRRLPPGLASNARSLKKLTISTVQHFQSLQNFGSVVELNLYDMPDLTRISHFPKLHKLGIYHCPKLESLQEMAALRRLMLTAHNNEKRLPMYLQTVKPSHLLLNCSLKVLMSMARGKSSAEWDKFSHIVQVEAYAKDGGNEKKWHLLYTCEPYNMVTNIKLNLQDIEVNEDK